MLNISSNLKEFERSLSDAAQKQLPYAVLLTINDTIMDVKKNREKDLERKLDRPTPFTKRGFYVRRATKRRWEAETGLKRVQAEYLKLNITGGSRKPKRRAIVVPKGTRLNKYGNMPKGSLRRILGRSNTFSGKVAGIGGVWQRTRKGVKLLARYEDRASYRPRYALQEPAEKTARGVLPKHLQRNLKKAWAARR